MTDLNLLLDLGLFRAQAAVQRKPLQRALYGTLKKAITDGRLQAGAVLPSSRDLARDLNMGRNGVIHAYEHLAAEGYVQASRLGTVVTALGVAQVGHAGGGGGGGGGAGGPEPLASMMLARRVQGFDRRRTPEDEQRPFMPGMPALDAFPLRQWQRLCERAARQSVGEELAYRHAQGESELRQAVATYVRASRGVRCDAGQVTITQGTQHSMELCAQVLADVGDRVWIEHPGYGGARTAFQQAGLALQPVTVDAQGMAPPADWWQTRPPRLIYLTPAHQYPLGAVLSLPRRMHLIEQARQAGAWILEDDYDSEFRHDGPPLSAMQGQVSDAPVVYLGTFSKSMFPALRLGFVVWPRVLADQVEGVVGALVRGGRLVEQRALAAFIDEGHFTRHLRRMRKLYAIRQQALREALLKHWPLPDSVLLGGQAGMHLVLSMPAAGQGGMDDALLAQRAAAKGLSPRPLSQYGTGGVGGFNGLVMGYANTHQDEMDAAVRRLVSAMGG